MPADDSDSRGSVEAVSILWQRRGMIGAAVAAATGLAALLLAVIPPRYTGEVLVALNTRTAPTAQVVTTKPSVVAPPLTTVLVETEMDILRSRRLAGQVVDALKLERDPEFNTRLKPSLLPAVVVAAWQDVVDALGTGGAVDDHTATVEAVRKRLAVKSSADSYAIRLGFEAEEPEKAALIANTFADLYIRDQRQSKLADIRVATGWINQQIAELRRDLDRETDDLVAFRHRNHLAPADTRDQGVVASQQLVAIETELARVQRDRADAEAELAQARQARKAGPDAMAALTIVEDSPYFQEVRKEEAKVLGKIAELSVGYKDNSPAVQALKGQLATLQHEMDRQIAGQVGLLANRAAQARAREDVLKARIDDITNGSAASDAAMSELEQRQKLIQAKNTMLDSFLARLAELTNRAELDEPDAHIASRAAAPARPSFPKPWLFLGVAFTGSLGLSVSLAFFLERFRSGFQSTRQVREVLDLPTFGIIPRLPRRALPGDHLVDKPESAYAEAVRSAQLALLNARGGVGAGGGGAVMVTSSLPGEGKTAFAVSLGRSLALAGRRTLLVDADLRRPGVARQLDAYRIPGLADLLGQHASPDEAVRHDPRTGLDFVAAGARTRDPQRLLGDPRLRGLFATWLAAYDMVLVDTPPVMVAFDAALLADNCGMALYVVEWDRTPRRAVEAGIEHLRGFDVPVAGVVLSKIDLDRQRQYGDYVDFCFRNSEYYGE